MIYAIIPTLLEFAVKDEMKEIIERIVPPTRALDDPDDVEDDAPSSQVEGAPPARPPAVPSAAPAHARANLLPRQEAFCRCYATQPVATRAAVLAGYAERSAYNQGHRLLQSAEVLERIAELRAERDLTYVLERDTMHDKLEGVFMQALADRDLAPAIAAVRVQATLAGLLPAARIGGRIGGRAAVPARRRKNDEESRARLREMMRKANQ